MVNDPATRDDAAYLSVFRQGDVGTNWYAVLSGSLDMNVSETGDSKVSHLMSIMSCIDE